MSIVGNKIEKFQVCSRYVSTIRDILGEITDMKITITDRCHK